jgi:glucokinase
MALLAFDLGGTKLAVAVFESDGTLLFNKAIPLEKRKGTEVGSLIVENIKDIKETSALQDINIESVGICVPGIYHADEGTVWAPNIPGWDHYGLLAEIREAVPGVPVTIDSDRACSILGEVWKGNAAGCEHAIFLAVGTGIGAGILIDGKVLRGAHDIAGAIGWMALNPPFKDHYISCGCFEHYASGEGIARIARIYIDEEKDYTGELKNYTPDELTSYHVFTAYKNKDAVAVKTIHTCIQYWGMAAANLVSLFNPRKIIFGGGIFGPAVPFIPEIKKEAEKWAQPISITKVDFEATSLGSDAGVYGAGYLALQKLKK